MKRIGLYLFLLCLSISTYADDKTLNRYHYWVDSDHKLENYGNFNGGTLLDFDLDVSSLSEGVHLLNYHIEDSEGLWSAIQQHLIYIKSPQEHNSRELVAMEYWLDDDVQQATRRELISNMYVDFDLDAASLSEGMHYLNYRVVDNKQTASPISRKAFLYQGKKVTELKKITYWWGTQMDKATTTEIAANNYLWDEELKVPEYAKNDPTTEKGVATFHAIFIDDLGKSSPVITENIIYAKGPSLSCTLSSDKKSVSLSWSYNDQESQVKDYLVYYAEDDGHYILWKPSTTSTSAKFYIDEDIKYKFLVVVRTEDGKRTSMDDEWAVVVENNL